MANAKRNFKIVIILLQFFAVAFFIGSALLQRGNLKESVRLVGIVLQISVAVQLVLWALQPAMFRDKKAG